MGEDSLSGLAVQVAFRMEKLAGKLALSRLLSASAAEHLPSHIPRAPAGSHELAGVSGRHEFFAAWPEAPSEIPSAG